MNENKRNILVPVDFSEVAEIAVKHAIEFAKKIESNIYLLHVIQKPVIYIGRSSTQDTELIEEATITRLQKMANDIENEHKIHVEIIAVPGSIYDTINAVSAEIEAAFVFMGTHGMKGFQFIRGSNALRVVYHSLIPFILTQKESTKIGEYNSMVFPLDCNRESPQKVDWALYLAKYFKSKIHILYAKETDKYLERRVLSNVNYCKKVFDANQVEYKIVKANKSTTGLSEEINSYAKSIDADLIMIMLYPEKGAGEFFLTPGQQKIIANPSGIPVICINPGTMFLLEQ